MLRQIRVYPSLLHTYDLVCMYVTAAIAGKRYNLLENILYMLVHE
jgi:hypothetical protein